MRRVTGAVTTGLGYAAALVVIPAAMGLIALRRISGFAPAMERPVRYFAAAIPAMFGITVRVRGLRHLTAAQEGTGFCGVVVANHVNIFDAFILRGYLPLPMRGVELESHFHWPVYGTVMRLFGNIPVPHGTPLVARRQLTRARRVLERGVPLLVLPEGHRTRTGKMQRFMSGPFRLAKDAHVPILPVVMTGAFERQRVGTIRINPGVVELRIAPVIPRSLVQSLSERELRGRTRAIMELL